MNWVNFLMGACAGAVLGFIITFLIMRPRRPKHFVRLIDEVETSYNNLLTASKGMQKVHAALMEVEHATR